MKLHIGCGKKKLPGFLHIDVIPHDHIDFVTDAKNLSMIADNSVDEIYACHVLEHFKRFETLLVLKEWNRVLKKNGVLRLSVPSFESIVAMYLKTGNLDNLIGLLFGGQTYDYNFHHMAFDQRNLNVLLAEAGFSKGMSYDWRDFLPEDYDDYSRAYLPHMEFKSGTLMSLNVVARKIDLMTTVMHQEAQFE